MLGFGVYALDPATTRRAVEDALAAGFRHIDTAQSYANEADVGAAFAASGLHRDEVFLTTKITPRNFGAGALGPSVEASRDALGVDQIDLTLIHYPSPWDEVPIEVYLGQLREAQDRGLTRMIGVSNFTVAQMIRAEEILGHGNVATNQIEIRVYHQNPKVVAHSRARAIPATAYCALARGMVFGIPEARLGPHKTLLTLAEKHDATVSQICLAFLIAEGHMTLSTTTDPDQMRDNVAAGDVALTAEDIALLRAMDRGKRIVAMPYFPDFD